MILIIENLFKSYIVIIGVTQLLYKNILPNQTIFFIEKRFISLIQAINKIFLCLNIPDPLNLVNGLFRN